MEGKSTVTEEEKSVIQKAAKLLYPHKEGEQDLYFNSCQNSRRGDFCDGVRWYIDHTRHLTPLMHEIIRKLYEEYDPEDDEEASLWADMKFYS
jgi:hypothetical protein